jgi:glycosyltransferase involved in cell wall biosynthesis
LFQSYVNYHNINGLLFPSGDIDELVNQLNRLLINSNLRDSLGLEALKVREVYHIDKVMAMWLDVLFS